MAFFKQTLQIVCKAVHSMAIHGSKVSQPLTMAHLCGPDGSRVCPDSDPFAPGTARASGLVAFRHEQPRPIGHTHVTTSCMCHDVKSVTERNSTSRAPVRHSLDS